MFTNFLILIKCKKAILYAPLLLIVVFESSCKSKAKQLSSASFDSSISRNDSYKLLNQKKELSEFNEEQDSLAKRTSGVLYYTSRFESSFDSISAKQNKCKAHLFNYETLLIKVGFGNPFGGWGFIINYKNKKFYVEPYYYTDVISDGEKEPVYEIVYQKLTLDKTFYKAGDSLFGKVDFEIFEIGQDYKKVKHSGKGYFRAIVTKK